MTHYYFSYGSYMLGRCFQVLAPSALRVDVGKLNHYRLEFSGYSEPHRGALATVVQARDAVVYGAIWKIDRRDLENLDTLEATGGGAYRAIDQCIERANGSMLLCRMHQQKTAPHVDDDVNMRWRTLPSVTYIDTIREGANESKLPADYISFLFSLKDNGRTTSLDNMLSLEESRKRLIVG